MSLHALNKEDLRQVFHNPQTSSDKKTTQSVEINSQPIYSSIESSISSEVAPTSPLISNSDRPLDANSDRIIGKELDKGVLNKAASVNPSASERAGLKPHWDQEAPSSAHSLEDESRFKENRSQLEEDGYDGFPDEVYAGFWVRLAAYLVDLFFILQIQTLLSNLFGPTDSEILGGQLALILDLTIYCTYFFLMNLVLKGQTPGKILFNLRLVPLNTHQSSLPFTSLLIREFFGRIIFYFVPLIAILLLFTPKKQHPIDLLTDTTVLNERYLDARAKWSLI